MSPSFLVTLTSDSKSWTSSRKRWLPFTSNSWHLPPPYHMLLWYWSSNWSSNLPFLYKIQERAVATQLHQHMSNHEFYEPIQSGFKACHSTETACYNYMLPLGQIFHKYGLNFHSYSDDTQLYLCTKPSTQLPPQSLVNCLHDIKLTSNLLKLNTNKTELMVVASKALLQKAGDLLLDVDSCSISPSTEVCNLGVIFDSTLSFQSHIKSITKSAFVAETLIHAFITSRLDYCNGALSGISSKTLGRLQYVQNCAARVLTHTKPWQHITSILIRLLWLPVKSSVTYKNLLLTYKYLHSLAPQYLSDLLLPYTQSQMLYSSGTHQLSIPHTKLQTLGDRAFCVTAPTLWNTLPAGICKETSLETFKRDLKTHLFNEVNQL